MVELRRDALDYFRTKLGIVIVGKLNSLFDGVLLADIAHMNRWFKQHGGTLSNLTKIWFVLFGQFGGASIRTYIKKVADEYMSTKGIKYVANKNLNGLADKEKIGCYEDLVSHAKTLIVKSVNYNSKTRHGWTIKLQRTKLEIDAKTRYKKRKSDKTLESFAVRENKYLLNPRDYIVSLVATAVNIYSLFF